MGPHDAGTGSSMTAPAPWQPLGGVPPPELTEGRLQMHHALQPVSAVGRSLLPAARDDGHTSLEWLASRGCLAGPPVPAAPGPLRAGLQPDPFVLLVLVEGAPFARLPLAGKTVEEASSWLAGRLGDAGADAGRIDFAVPYSLPEHPVGDGARFAPPETGALVELGRLFADADLLLREAAASWPGATPVRIWPHHLDAGVVLPIGEGSGEGARSIGAGLSPGDETIPEPYLYVTPWPPPPPESLPALPSGGRWQREGWVGAALTASELVGGGGPGQEERARAFLAGTIGALRASARG